MLVPRKRPSEKKIKDRQRKRLTFAAGVRIPPRLVLLAVVFTAPQHLGAAAEDRRTAVVRIEINTHKEGATM